MVYITLYCTHVERTRTDILPAYMQTYYTQYAHVPLTLAAHPSLRVYNRIQNTIVCFPTIISEPLFENHPSSSAAENFYHCRTTRMVHARANRTYNAVVTR